MLSFLTSFLMIALLVIGFGFVIFWHELGHFLAAKWVGIRVEQFAVGMGHALCSYRRGIGWKWGSTQKEFEKRVREQLEKNGNVKKEYTDSEVFDAADELGLGETEYRIAWFPVGGYVKPYGQDDLDMSARKEDRRSYSSKTVGQRMFVISAGVIMNVILAGILFMALFLYGFKAPAPVVGNIQPLSPAQFAGTQVGEEIESYNGARMHDFTKMMLETALSSPNEDVPLVVKEPGTGAEKMLMVRARRASPDSKSFLALGISSPLELTGPKQTPIKPADANLEIPGGWLALQPGDVITKVNGQDVRPDQYYIFDRALQKSTPDDPVELAIRNAAGQIRTLKVEPHFMEPFAFQALDLAGMEPRMEVGMIASKDSPLYGKLKAGDIIDRIIVRTAPKPEVHAGITIHAFRELMKKVGSSDLPMDIVAIRGGKEITIPGVKAIRLERGIYGLGIAPYYDQEHPVIACVMGDSPAAKANIPAGATLLAIDGKPVKNWFDVRRLLATEKPASHQVKYSTASGEESTAALQMDAAQLQHLADLRLAHDLQFAEMIRVRQTSNPLTAISWGVSETRDLILQFYVTLRRMISRDVSPSNLMGPVGIFGAGAKFAFKGPDWLIWFLAMISANLAVVNFLPIPIVDGGHFVFLLIEKITGKPPSRKVLEVAQLAGIVFILGVFVFVTWNDISRMAGWQ